MKQYSIVINYPVMSFYLGRETAYKTVRRYLNNSVAVNITAVNYAVPGGFGSSARGIAVKRRNN